MPNSERGGWGRPAWIGAAVLALCLAAVAARVVWFDPYWLFRAAPPWLAETHGSNRLIDRQTRRAKILQALDRHYDIALVGSSTVYHGLDPGEADPALRDRIYNVGISALMGRELPTVAAVIASRHVARATIGLDYYMFSRRGGPVPIAAAIATPLGRWNAWLGSFVGLYAIEDSYLGAVAGSDDPGAWTRAGFRITPPLPPVLTRESDAIRRRTTAAYLPDTMGALDTVLDRLRGVDLTVYLSPVSDAQRRVMSDLGVLDDFERWRRDAARRVESRGVRFLDLTELGRGLAFDPQAGSSEMWIDNLHYTPVLGRKVLEALGLRPPSA